MVQLRFREGQLQRRCELIVSTKRLRDACLFQLPSFMEYVTAARVQHRISRTTYCMSNCIILGFALIFLHRVRSCGLG